MSLWDYLFGSALNSRIVILNEKLDHLTLLVTRMEKAMHEEFAAMVARLNTATNDLGARITKIQEQLANGVTPEQAAPLLAELADIAGKLEAMGKDPENPIP